MGYFPNGTAGDVYEATYCMNCIHNDRNEVTCPVTLAHLRYNYDQCNDKNSILHILIPRTETGENQRCAMFVPRSVNHV